MRVADPGGGGGGTGIRVALVFCLLGASLGIPPGQVAASSGGLSVGLGDFELSCGASNVVEGASLSCRLEYGGSDEAEWPVVGLLHSSGDSHRALVVGSGVDVEFGGVSGASLERSNVWVGEDLVGYSRLDWPGEASASDVKTFAVDAVDDAEWEPEEVFYIGLWNSGSKNVGGLFENRAQVVVPENDAKSSNASLERLLVSAGGDELDLSPAFSSSIQDYQVNAGYETSELVVQPVAAHGKAAVTVNGEPSAEQGVAVGLAIGSNPISISVTAEDSSTSTYAVDVIRADQSGSDPISVSVDGFTLSCPSSVADNEADHTCVLQNTTVHRSTMACCGNYEQLA